MAAAVVLKGVLLLLDFSGISTFPWLDGFSGTVPLLVLLGAGGG